MKRHLISDEMTKKNEHKVCTGTGLSILGNCRALVGERRDASESERRDFKRPKLQTQQPPQAQETSTKIEDDTDHSRTKNNDSDKSDSKLRYLDLVSSAANLIEKQAEKRSKEQQQEDAASSSSVVSIVRRSRSESLSSEHSIYRSYEMEFPNFPQLPSCTNDSKMRRLIRPPRLPTASDLPLQTTSAINCMLETRSYGDIPGQQRGYNSNKNKSNSGNQNMHSIDKELTSSIRIKSVIYQ